MWPPWQWVDASDCDDYIDAWHKTMKTILMTNDNDDNDYKPDGNDDNTGNDDNNDDHDNECDDDNEAGSHLPELIRASSSSTYPLWRLFIPSLAIYPVWCAVWCSAGHFGVQYVAVQCSAVKLKSSLPIQDNQN